MKHKPFESREVIYITDDEEPKRCPRSGGFAGFLVFAAMIALFLAGTRFFVGSRCCNRSEARAEHQQTWRTLGDATRAVEQYREEHDGRAPAGVEGNRLALPFIDAWGKELRYEILDDAYVLRSAGRDGEYDTHDDLANHMHLDETEHASTTSPSDLFE